MGGKRSSIPKITCPRISKVFHRKRLFRLLDNAKEKPIIWITGPAGSGKTTLILSYLDDRKLPCLWYQLDQGDTDIASFFYYLSLAKKKAAPRKRKDLPLLTTEYLTGILTFTRRYFENLYCCFKAPFVIVFDDYQQIDQDSIFHEILCAGLSRITEGITVILASRENPPLSMIRLHANHYMELLGWKELRFTIEESKELIKFYSKGGFSEKTIQELHNITQGWAVGLVLMLLQIKTDGIEPKLLSKHTPKEIFDYFADEIFKNMDRETQNFLLKTAFLPKMTTHIAENLTGITQADCILSKLIHQNNFLENIYQPDLIYQYHPLFRKFLLILAKDTFSQKDITYIQHKAGELLEKSGYIEDAVELYSKTGEWNKLSQLILRQAKLMVSQGRNQTIENWLNRLPPEILDCEPWLLYWMGMCLLPFNIVDSRKYFEKAYKLFKNKKDPSGLFLSVTNLINSFLIERGSSNPLDRWIAELEKLLNFYPDFQSKEIEAMVTLSMSGALMCYQPMHPALPEWERRANLLIQNSIGLTQRMIMGSWLVFYYLRIGEYSKAGLIIDILKPTGNLSDNSPMILIVWRTLETAYCWITNHCNECQNSAQKGLEIAKTSGIHIWDCLFLAFGAYSALSSGNYSFAEEYLGKMSSLLNENTLYDTSQYHYLRAWESWLKNDISLSLEHMEKAITIAKWIGDPFILATFHTGIAEILFVNGKYCRAANHLVTALKISRKIKCYPNEYKCLLVKSYFAFESGNEGQGLKYLKRAMSLGRKKGFVIIDFLHPSIMASLCAKAIEAGIEVEFVQDLISKLKLIPNSPFINCEHWPWPLKFFTMGRFAVIKDGKQVQFSAKVPKKPLELLKIIISFGERNVSEVQVRDILWPDSDGDMAHRSFTVTLHRLRQLLGNEKAVLLKDGKLSLDLRFCWVDAWDFENILGLSDEVFKNGNKCMAIQLIEKAVAIYKGPFLPGDEGKSWSISYREHLRYKFIYYIDKLGNYKEKTGALNKAIECFTKGLEVDDLAEEFYQHLMLCLLQIGRKSEALSVYHRCRKSLVTTLEIEPSLKTKAIYKSLLSN